MIGQIVGTYRIVSMLGSGGMGAVWLAEHTLLGRRVAIKFLHAEISQHAAIVERFFAEARAATRIADPGIVVIFDFGWHTDHSAYIVMEHLNGESVAARLRNGRFRVGDAVRVVQQSAMAMAVAHASGIIHRDLKPDNIFLVPDPAVAGGERIKILDFGIAKLVGDEHGNPTRTRTGAIMGTPTYMSPEQCRGAGDIDHRTDIYALGCVLFHLLCGRVPFVATTPGDMIAAHLREPPIPPSALAPEVPPGIDAIVMRCLAKVADDRYATMTELVRDLAATTGSPDVIPTIPPILPTPRPSAPVAAPPPAVPLSTFASTAGESLVRPPRRGRVLGIVIAAAAVAMVTIAIVVATSNKTPTPTTQPDPPATAPLRIPPAIDAGTSIDAALPTVTIDAGAPPDAPAKPKPRPRPRPRDPKGCDGDPYACP
jgi:serine/threonine protein kinase